MKRKLLISLAAVTLATLFMGFGLETVVKFINGMFSQAQPEYDYTPVFFVGRANITVPFRIEDNRYFIDASINDKSMEVLFDTGSAMTILKGNPKDFVTTGKTNISGFNGGTNKTYETLQAQVCIATDCDTELVAIVPELIDTAILRGGFLKQFHKATFDFKQKTLTLEAK